MRFALGFLVGLLTGILLVLAPIVSVFFALAISGAKDEEETTVPEEIS